MLDSWQKFDEWIKQHAPLLSKVYENKYAGMLYDRFASLPPKQQKQVLLGILGGGALFIFLVIFSSYISFWSYSSKASQAQAMVSMLQKYQKDRRAQESQIQVLERNNRFAQPDALKQHLIEAGRSANISPRMIKAEERGELGERTADPKMGQDIKLKQASVKLERVNLNQLRSYLQTIEGGGYSLSIASLDISNDEKIRGYMNVEIGVVAYLFKTEGEGGL